MKKLNTSTIGTLSSIVRSVSTSVRTKFGSFWKRYRKFSVPTKRSV